MVRQHNKDVEITIKLTPRQIKEAYRQLMDKQKGKDWLDDPKIFEMLARREAKVAREIKQGQFISLKELQSKLSRD
ncbi:MAG: hypothetical protein HW384_395 [Dehalococcoidia bacterium]|nr:hypothetical protein [Dehalococcoidia bacterium]MBF8304230.1 hypothetical protein [Dehalococcoidia bacterium]